MTDHDLLQGLRDQNPSAVERLSECYLPSVWRFVYVRVGGDRHLAEDIVSETVLALIRAVADPETDINNPGGWLRSVAANKVTDHYRAAARVQHLIDQVQQTSATADHADPAGRQVLEERREEIRGIMDALPEQHRIALEWKYLDKLSVREIADRMQVTEKAAASILYRARCDFRERLMRQDKEVPPVGGHANGNGHPQTPDNGSKSGKVEKFKVTGPSQTGLFHV